MKKVFFSLLVLMLAIACGQDKFVVKGTVAEGETLPDGTTEYNIKYRFVRNVYEGDEKVKVLKECYPDIYALARAGLVKDVLVYKFVDQNTGQIFNQIAYNWSEIWFPRRRR